MTWRHDVHAVAARFTAAIEALDLDALDRLLAPQATAWFNFMGPDGGVLTKQQVIDNLVTARTLMRDFRYVTTTREATALGYWQTGRIRCLMRSGAVATLRAALLAEVDDAGRITAYREWLDSADLAPLYAGMAAA